MKFQVSVLSEKGTKKQVLEVVADSYTETTGTGYMGAAADIAIKFYITDYPGWWARSVDRLVASVMVHSSYVVEEASDAAYS